MGMYGACSDIEDRMGMIDYKIDVFPRLFHFKKPAGTSRGVYTVRDVRDGANALPCHS